MNKSFKITIEQVHAGYDLTISKDQQSATLLMPDKEQANSIAQKIINLAEQHNMTINAACSLFNTGAAMYIPVILETAALLSADSNHNHI